MPDAPWNGPQAEDDLTEKEKSMRNALTEAPDLLTDLKTACEKLGYRVERRALSFYYQPKGAVNRTKITEKSLTPDLCKEMKDWMRKEYNLSIESWLRKPNVVRVFFSDKDHVKMDSVFAETEELAVLAAFLEVTKEKPE